jgi:hypothetical protein
MTAADKATEKAKQETAPGAAPANTTSNRGAEGTLDFTTEAPKNEVVHTPEWATGILTAFSEFSESLTEFSESKAELLEVGKAVIQAVADFKEAANDLIDKISSAAGPVIQEAAAQATSTSVYNEYADYVVAEGKEFRAPNDFSIIHKEGENVNHLGRATLIRLLEQGLIIESDED